MQQVADGAKALGSKGLEVVKIRAANIDLAATAMATKGWVHVRGALPKIA